MLWSVWHSGQVGFANNEVSIFAAPPAGLRRAVLVLFWVVHVCRACFRRVSGMSRACVVFRASLGVSGVSGISRVCVGRVSWFERLSVCRLFRLFDGSWRWAILASAIVTMGDPDHGHLAMGDRGDRRSWLRAIWRGDPGFGRLGDE